MIINPIFKFYFHHIILPSRFIINLLYSYCFYLFFEFHIIYLFYFITNHFNLCQFLLLLMFYIMVNFIVGFILKLN